MEEANTILNDAKGNIGGDIIYSGKASQWKKLVNAFRLRLLMRTGIPTLNVGPGTYNSGQVPKRWLYPQSEYDYNTENVDAAIQRQYSGNDNVNGAIWILQ